MNSLWSGLSLVSILQARVRGHMPVDVTGISMDTRTLQPGDLFFAITGDTSDGHHYVRAAFEKGAAAAVIAQPHAERLAQAGPLYIVHDVLEALEALGRAARARSQAQIIGVTGSVGKTSTKEALRSVLGHFGQTHASLASYNNHWGVPLTLARLPLSSDFGVFEIGMNHAGEITQLVSMVQPHIAIITTVAPVHLAQFDSVDAIAAAKAEIFSGLVPGGIAIIHADIPQTPMLTDAAKAARAGEILTFGKSDLANARLDSIELRPTSSTVHATIRGRSVSYVLGAPGEHQAVNSLAVILAAECCGISLEHILPVMQTIRPETGRGSRLQLMLPQGKITVIDESYNANPASMRAALALLGQAQTGPRGRKIAVLGDMLELGEAGPALHAGLLEAVLEAKIDKVFCAGPLMRNLYKALPEALQGGYGETSADLAELLKYMLTSGDVMMIKGSNGSKMGAIIAAFKSTFSFENLS